MVSVDSTAHIAPGARIGSEVVIGPYSVIGPDVEIGDRCRLAAHVNIAGHTRIGPGTTIAPFASLGTPPQSVHYRGGPTRLVVGASCDIRENVTMNIGTEDDRGVTQVGERCFFMAGSHVAHDCTVGNDVTFANNAVLGGHVTVEDHVFLGGNAAVHQFVRIGEGAMVAGLCGVRADVIPFGFCVGVLGRHAGLNVVGMRRRRMSQADLHAVRRVYRELFHGEGEFAKRLDAVERDFADNSFAMQIVKFIRARGKRPLALAWESGRSPGEPEVRP
jgi:UDP-N-acetylglucosamine acyltransferase